MIDKIITVSNPVWILHAKSHIAPRPVLCLEATAFIIHFKQLIGFKTIAR